MLLVGTILGGWAAPAMSQAAPETAPAAPAAVQPAPQPQVATVQAAPQVTGTIRSISVRGSQRLETGTIISYSGLQPGQGYSAETLDQALKDLYATELFSDVVITGAETGAILITVQENPVINRIVLEGNRRLKNDKITPEIQLKPREIFTRSKVRADVDRIIELYKRQGRFAARVEPKIVQLDQNRVDLIFEIYEGAESKVRRINIIGNEAYGDGRLRKEMYTRQAGGVLGFLKSNDTYDPDRLAADQQKLRAFYLTEGYADFRVVSALAELTPDRQDFIITYVVEEGPRYKFGAVDAASGIRDLPKEKVLQQVGLKPGEWFDAKAVEDTVTALSATAGALGYAFASIDPSYKRNPEARTMDVTFRVGESPRVYVEDIQINGNTVTRDKVIRREFRVNEGDAFNAIKIKRSQDRIQSLGFFQENLEIKQTEGSGPDRVVLGVDVQEKPTGQLQFSAGYSSLERFLLSLSVQQTNFRGMGQVLDAGLSWSRYSKSISAGFTDPYFLDKNILLGGQLFRRDYSSFNYVGGSRNTTYSQVSTGGGLRMGFPVTEYLIFGTRYSLVQDKISLSKALYYSDPDGPDGPNEPVCDPLRAGRYLCDEIGTRVTSSVGYSLAYDDTDGIRPTRGQRVTMSQDFAGLGGDVRYLRTRADATKYKSFGAGWILSAHLEGGYIHSFQNSPGPGRDPVRLTDRFFGAQMRGFDIRGIGPRILRLPYNDLGEIAEPSGDNQRVNDALGGHAYYMGRLELEVPVSAGIRSLGLRPSAFVDIGSVWGLKKPNLTDLVANCTRIATPTVPGDSIDILPGDPVACPAGYIRSNGFKEVFVGNSPKPRLSIGVGVNWVSPFGPLRIDIAKALLKQEGDDTKLFSFNVGTQF
ncbi:outer membrane protein assembly factor BamA [Sphingomonas sabuli]|uniref:Outer membrane protein assembly factor BamA n=1 Tax=Sphingomonas sabuli TaxID=2764186 RepID=A0A7G9L3L6_9SPHN|nr:outer membrane protein assembly factor BamA [Sphingomonas sabuli]QNM83215.1 outer membrane protein assembly factor BamA [Sphingomonas sabuli]